jgi:hypothetical protein
VSICVWGKPPDSHADDPRRAVSAACELATSLRRVAAAHGRADDAVSCGVTTGRAFCGNVGSASRCEWSVVGDVMNNAARLMAAASATVGAAPVLCCAVTARHVRAALAEVGDEVPPWLDAPPRMVALKGAAAPMHAQAPSPADDPAATATSPRRGSSFGSGALLQPIRRDESFGSCRSSNSSSVSGHGGGNGTPTAPERRRSSAGAALLGRDSELARVASLLDSSDAAVSGGAQDGAAGGPLMVVSGGVSCGKSAFLRAAGAQAFASGRAVLPLRVGGGDSAFDTPWFAAAVEAHVDTLPATLRPLAPLLAQLVPSAGLDPSALATPDSGAALAALAEPQAALCALAVEVLRPVIERAASGGAVVLLSDDACTLDELSCALLAEVHARLAPAVLLALPRAALEDAGSDGARLVSRLSARASACRTCTLGPLPPPAVAELCASVLGVPLGALPAGLVPALMRLAGGHPLLLKEQLVLLLRQGHLLVDDTHRRVTLCADLAALPGLIAAGLTDEHGVARLEIFMQRRLDSLGPAGRTAVRAAAVLGAAAVWDLPLIAAACAPGVTFGAVCAAAAELVHEGIWAHAPPAASAASAASGSTGATAGDEDESGAACYVFSHEVVRSLVFAATPEDVRAELHACVLASLQEHAAAAGASGGHAGGERPQPASVWAEWGRLARGAHAYMQAARLFLTAAQVSLTSASAGGLRDAAKSAHEGIACLRDARRVDAGGSEPHEAQQPSQLSSTPPRMSQSHHAAAPRMSASEQRAAAAATMMRRRNSVPANPVHAALLRELTAVLDTVARVQASWPAVAARLDEVAAAMTRAFVARAPALLTDVRGKRGDALTAPHMAPVLHAHQATLLRLVGTTVAGERDLEALAPTLVQCGRMHARFGDTIRDFYPAAGAAMADALRATLGPRGFSAEVEGAWAAAYAWVAKHMVAGINQAARASAEEASLRFVLQGGALPAAAMPAAAPAVAAAAG